MWLFVAICVFAFTMDAHTSITGSILPVTCAGVLLSQGIGIRYEFLLITIMPLLSTFMALACAIALIRRFHQSWPAFWSFVATWTILDVGIYQVSPVTKADSLFIAVPKFMFFAVIAQILACGIRSISSFLDTVVRHTSQLVARMLRISFLMAAWLMGLMLVLGLATALCWLVINHDAATMVGNFINLSHWSFVALMAMALLWFPNMAIWALSWLVGSGFHIGTIATFTLWGGQANDLPALPVFAIFPTAMQSEQLRWWLQNSPLILGFVLAFAFFVSPRQYDLLQIHFKKRPRLVSARTAVDYAMAFVSICLSSIWIVLLCTFFFSIPNGRLGTGRLTSLGINDVMESTRNIARPAAIGFFYGFLLVVVMRAIIELFATLNARTQAIAKADELSAKSLTLDDLEPVADTRGSGHSPMKSADSSSSERQAASSGGTPDGIEGGHAHKATVRTPSGHFTIVSDDFPSESTLYQADDGEAGKSAPNDDGDRADGGKNPTE